MAFKSQKIVLLAKPESVYGTDSVPVGATNAILAGNVKLVPMTQEAPARNTIRPYFSNEGKLLAGKHVQLDFDVEIAGAGAAGSAPGWGALLKGCAMGETISAGVSAVYAPISAGEQSLSLYFCLDGIQHKLLGARGSFSMKFSKGGIPLLNFKFIGLYAAPTDTALPAPTLTGFQKALAVCQANTTPVSLHTYAGIFQDISLDIGNSNLYRNLIGSESIAFVDRKPAGSCTMELPTIAAKDWFSIAAAGTTGALTLTHGTAAGNKVTIGAPAVQVTNPTYSSADNIEHLGLTLDLLPSAGNDELTITVL